MKNLCLLTNLKKELQTTPSNKEQVIDFYNEATEDYRFWSNDLNMHFGYFVPLKTCVFKRDGMLNRMNDEVFKESLNFDLEFKDYYYLASKEGLLAHNGR